MPSARDIVHVFKKDVQKHENNNGNLLLGNPVNRLPPVDDLPPGDSNKYILLKDALNGNKLNLSLIHNKVLVVKRLLSTNDNMIWNAYSTFDDVNEKPVEINIKYATFKLHLNGLLSFMKLVASGTVKTFYCVCVAIKDERQEDMPMDKIVRETYNVEHLLFVFSRLAQVTSNNFTQLPHFPNLKKVTFGNIPEHIDESVVVAFEKKYPYANCSHSYHINSTNDRSSN
uniref:Uncharacterized protein n=1 Tax=Panagrolaimus sp. PS1159 TaxID=55785 RepID=A0AC35FWL0_9BILA